MDALISSLKGFTRTLAIAAIAWLAIYPFDQELWSASYEALTRSSAPNYLALIAVIGAVWGWASFYAKEKELERMWEFANGKDAECFLADLAAHIRHLKQVQTEVCVRGSRRERWRLFWEARAAERRFRKMARIAYAWRLHFNPSVEYTDYLPRTTNDRQAA